jgi:hypothetical protein
LAGNINGTLFPPLEQKFVFGNGIQHLEAFVRHSKVATKDFVESWIVKLSTLHLHVVPSRSRNIMCHGGAEDRKYRIRTTITRHEITSKVLIVAMTLKAKFFLP